MRQALGFIVSVLIHLGLVASALVAFPQARRLADELMVVPVELVTLSDITNVRAARPEPEPEPENIPDTPAPQTAPEPVPVPETAPEPEIIPPAPEPEPEPQAPEPEPEPERPEPEPEPEPQSPEPEPEPQGLDLNSLSQLVDRSRESAAPQGQAETDETRQGAGAGTAMTATLQIMAASHLNRCIRSVADAPANMDLRVTIEIRLERNGRLSSTPRLIDEARIMNSPNSYLRVAGERAIRGAVRCEPYPFPPEHYQQWRVLRVNVDTQQGRYR